jgi:fluoroacetyl-CoA thioesterase
MLAIGASATAILTVEEQHLARAVAMEAGDTFPPVFATAQMIALMEVAGARTMKPLLQIGELSVGVEVNVRHSAATLLGDTVRATALFTGMQGKFYAFEVVAEDSRGEIGRGTHLRAVVSEQRLLDGIRKRSGQ